MYSLQPQALLEASEIDLANVRQFMALWDRVDVLSTGVIPNDKNLVRTFVSQLDAPLGCSFRTPHEEQWLELVCDVADKTK